MTKRKDSVVRHFPPRFASRETMAYLLDISTDTFDRLVTTGSIERATLIGGLMRWPVERVMERLEGCDTLVDDEARERAEIRAGTVRAFTPTPRKRSSPSAQPTKSPHSSVSRLGAPE